MTSPTPVSLFAGKQVEGSEIKFRAVCALGWELNSHLAELRRICDDLPQEFDVIHWIDQIESQLASLGFSATHAATWPGYIRGSLLTIAQLPQVACFPSIVGFLQKLMAGVTILKAQDPSSQLDDFNQRGFTLATQMINDPRWSTRFVQQRWKQTSAHPLVFQPARIGNFQPVTMDKNRIELRVNTAEFDVRNSLLFYTTLEFQMMHEYISHALPVWNSGNPLEEEFLLAVMFLYYRECGPNDGHAFLVNEADGRRADSHGRGRKFIQHELAAGREPRLSQLSLHLAVLDDREMELARKKKFLALLKKSALEEDAALKASIDHWIRTEDPPALLEKLSTVFSKSI